MLRNEGVKLSTQWYSPRGTFPEPKVSTPLTFGTSKQVVKLRKMASQSNDFLTNIAAISHQTLLAINRCLVRVDEALDWMKQRIQLRLIIAVGFQSIVLFESVGNEALKSRRSHLRRVI